MKINGNNGNFEPCPEYTGKAVCVDVTPLRKQPSQFGDRNVFKVVFEVDSKREDGTRFCVWSRNFTPTLNEKSNLRKFLRGWNGRDLNEKELGEFDTETLLGKTAQLVVVHEHKDGKVFANIMACTPDKSGAPLKPTGKYVRVKDRPSQAAGVGEPGDGSGAQDGNGNGNGGGYRRAAQPAAGNVADHATVKVHVGKCTGLELRDLSPEQINALVERWLPTAKQNGKPTADDKRLIAALEWFVASQNQVDDDNVPY